MARRYFRVAPPGLFEIEATRQVSELSLDNLRLLAAILEAELAQREGRIKYVLPAHVEQMLN
jgi:hypothetical protein